MASTVFCEACLAVHLRVKLSSVSRAIAAQLTLPLPQSREARYRRKSQLSYISSGRLPRIRQFTSDTNRLEWNEQRRTDSFLSNCSNEIERNTLKPSSCMKNTTFFFNIALRSRIFVFALRSRPRSGQSQQSSCFTLSAVCYDAAAVALLRGSHGWRFCVYACTFLCVYEWVQ